MESFRAVDVIDVSSLLADLNAGRALSAEALACCTSLHNACRDVGFFYIKGHGVDTALQLTLEQAAAQFFQLPVETKLHYDMALGGKAWRGYFPLRGELTSGIPDQKEVRSGHL
jgi:isopenicillin N synthase-like dioxygenase